MFRVSLMLTGRGVINLRKVSKARGEDGTRGVSATLLRLVKVRRAPAAHFVLLLDQAG